MTKFRFGITDMLMHRDRYKNVSNNIAMCPLCKMAKEDEIHILLCCPALYDLRREFIPGKFYANPCLFHLNLLLSSQCSKILKNVCIYLYKAFKRRASILADLHTLDVVA